LGDIIQNEDFIFWNDATNDRKPKKSYKLNSVFNAFIFLFACNSYQMARVHNDYNINLYKILFKTSWCILVIIWVKMRL
jgi:hypothetical protein